MTDLRMDADTLHPTGTGAVDVITVDVLPTDGIEIFNEGTSVLWYTKNTTTNPVANAKGAAFVPIGQWATVDLPRRRGNTLRILATGQYHLAVLGNE